MRKEQLQYFMASYQQHSFVEAAKLSHITPQGMAKAIRSLEKKLGVPLLLSRNDGSLVPTPYADRLYEYALQAMIEYEKLDKDFRAIKADEQALLRLGVSFGLLDTIGVSFLNQFEIINPKYTVVYSEDPDHICEEHLLSGQCDIAFTYAPFNENLETVLLGKVPFDQWVNKKNPLSTEEVIRVEHLREHTLATPGPGFKSYEVLMKLCLEKNVVPKSIQPSYDRRWILNFVLENRGIGTNVGLLLDIDTLREDSDVVTIPFEHVYLNYGISWRKDTEPAELQKAFIRQVQTFLHTSGH